MTIKITINGGPTNVWHPLGLKCNPFPQVPRAEWYGVNELLRELDSDPLDLDSLVKTLNGRVSGELRDICIQQFVPGERISFMITFPEN